MKISGQNRHSNTKLDGTAGRYKCYTGVKSYGSSEKDFTSSSIQCYGQKVWSERSPECQRLLSTMGCSGTYCRGMEILKYGTLKLPRGGKDIFVQNLT